MLLTDLAPEQAALLLLPILPNLWSIWHAMRHEFPGEREKYLWIMAAVFLPLIGGMLYLLSGWRRSRPLPGESGDTSRKQ
ncbi:MAG: PLDc_N domain-containing protein [Desulfovibrionaceae bacterium]|nr:PLDc_N domain-containing protein [Desulfovibrionaceae bacterium]